LSTHTHTKDKPPRLPLGMMRGYRTTEGMCVDELVVVNQGDDGYEQDDAYTARCHELYGEPMPYASVEGLAARRDKP